MKHQLWRTILLHLRLLRATISHFHLKLVIHLQMITRVNYNPRISILIVICWNKVRHIVWRHINKSTVYSSVEGTVLTLVLSSFLVIKYVCMQNRNIRKHCKQFFSSNARRNLANEHFRYWFSNSEFFMRLKSIRIMMQRRKVNIILNC